MAYREAGIPSTGYTSCRGTRPRQTRSFIIDHPHVIAEEAPRVAELCIGYDMGTMSTVTVFTEMEVGSVI